MSSDVPKTNPRIRSIDGMIASHPTQETEKKPARKKQRLHLHIRLTKRRFLIVAGLCVAIAAGCIAYWRLFIWQPAAADPFTAKDMSSVQFPLYYPTQLPSGFRTDTKSVSHPEQGVVVFYLIGPNNSKLYISEEVRDSTFNLGGFYNSFEGLKEIGVSDGAIAVGHLYGGTTEVASRANNKTWVLANTTAHIPLSQLQTMLKSLTQAG
jgi:hypothetical protein